MDVPERIEVIAGGEVVVTWEEGGTTSLSGRALRAACPCAACGTPSGVAATQRLLESDAEVTVEDVRLVGGYALAMTFEPDGHDTGIFPFATLRKIEG